MEQSKETILIIEDEPDVRENLRDILQLAQYEVIEAENGVQGLALAQSHHPDLIICDALMPQMDGFEVLEALREDGELATIPFIFLTALADLQHQREGMDLGADDYLTKPFEMDELLIAINSRLRKHQQITQKITEEQTQVASLTTLTHDQESRIADLLKALAIKDQVLSQWVEKQQILGTQLQATLADFQHLPSLPDQDPLLDQLADQIQRHQSLLQEAIALQQLLKLDNVSLLQDYQLL